MITKAESKYIRISPSKARMVMALVRGQRVDTALNILGAVNKKAAFLIDKILKSALASAKSKGYEKEKLFISKIVANPGPMLKRYRAASFGRATTIRKRTSHILVELDTSEKIIEGIKIK